MIDPTLASALAATLEKAVNLALHYDPSTRAKLSKLQNTVFQFACTAPQLSLFWEFDAEAEKLKISSYSENEISVKISGSLFDCLVFICSSEISGSSNLAESGLRVMGNSAKLANLQAILQELDIDWEQALIDLSSPLGEGANVLSHQSAAVIKKVLSWLTNSKNKFQKNIAAFLQEELRAIPTKTELNDFNGDLANLRSGVDRFEARLALFAKKASSTPNTTQKPMPR